MAVALSRTLPPIPADASQPARTAELRFNLLLLAAAVAVGSLLQLCGPSWSQAIFAPLQLDSLSGLLALLLALFVSIVAHELGHLFAAVLLNFEVLGGSIGPFQFDWFQNAGQVRFRTEQWFRCSISAVPREMPVAWRARMIAVVAAGPAVSLFFLLVSACITLAGQGAGELPSFWNCCVEVNFFLFILGLVPNSRFAAVRNDAALFLALLKNDADARDIFMCHQAIELGLRGIRPEDYPQPLLLDLARFAGRPYTKLMVARRMVEWALDSGHLALAAEWDQAALTAGMLCGARLANVALAESACFDVLFREDPRAAVRKFAGVDFKALSPPSLNERVYAAYLVAAAAPQKASRHILRAQYHLPPGNSYYHFERFLLDRLHTKALSSNSHGA